jgi:hypothetical protein
MGTNDADVPSRVYQVTTQRSQRARASASRSVFAASRTSLTSVKPMSPSLRRRWRLTLRRPRLPQPTVTPLGLRRRHRDRERPISAPGADPPKPSCRTSELGRSRTGTPSVPAVGYRRTSSRHLKPHTRSRQRPVTAKRLAVQGHWNLEFGAEPSAAYPCRHRYARGVRAPRGLTADADFTPGSITESLTCEPD